MNQQPETPGAVFAAALQQWRDALRPDDKRVGGTPPSSTPSLSAPESGHGPG